MSWVDCIDGIPVAATLGAGVGSTEAEPRTGGLAQGAACSPIWLLFGLGSPASC